MIAHDSFEVERLKKLILYKEKYLQTLQADKSKAAYQLVEREIMLLKKDILPIVQRNTMIIHHEFAKHAVSVFDAALQNQCNGMLLFQTIEKEYTGQPTIGIYNDAANQKYGTLGAIEIISMDGNGASINAIPIQL